MAHINEIHWRIQVLVGPGLEPHQCAHLVVLTRWTEGTLLPLSWYRCHPPGERPLLALSDKLLISSALAICLPVFLTRSLKNPIAAGNACSENMVYKMPALNTLWNVSKSHMWTIPVLKACSRGDPVSPSNLRLPDASSALCVLYAYF